MQKRAIFKDFGSSSSVFHRCFALRKESIKDSCDEYVVVFKDAETRVHEKTAGNELLSKKGTKYISGADNLDAVANVVRNYTLPKDLF